MPTTSAKHVMKVDSLAANDSASAAISTTAWRGRGACASRITATSAIAVSSTTMMSSRAKRE